MHDFHILDSTERTRALDPTNSFIVQAPAGSGKTTLLVQRYLKLLAHVNSPEEIIAITFTRKAAFEMKNRIITALKKADINHIATNPYEATTQKLAKEALTHSKLKNWDLIQNPNRLRLQTIDGLCHHLVSRAPILTKTDINAQVVRNQEADIYYSKAAQATLDNIADSQYSQYLKRLLLHLDNNWSRAEALFITMLKSREQWLPHIVGLKNIRTLRHTMELALQEIAQEHIELCTKFLTEDLYQKLAPLLQFKRAIMAADKASQTKKLEKIANDIDAVIMGKESWQEIANLLLTKEFAWRKKITKEQGFPAPTSAGISKAEKELFKSMKISMEELLAELNQHENLRLNLENLLLSPKPNYSDQQWELIEALLELLPLLAAQLKLIFTEYKVIDHAEISMAASLTLGDPDAPSDLALNFDYRLQHLLIDEFQDTSLSQYQLIEKLITTWQQNDGRTIFMVGDPMQSIYRFREAEVGLFLRVQNNGIGDLKPMPLALTTNFRSTKNIINWINKNFSKIMPANQDISCGAVPFKPSIAITDDQHSAVTINLIQDGTDDAEAEHLTTTIKNIITQTPDATIAILVKSRTHLPKILLNLRHTGLKYQAVELETFHERMIIRDLFSLTRALFDLTDRIAWLAILRAPWCGLSLKDLHQIAHGGAKIIWDNICNYQQLNLSDDGKNRIKRFTSTILPFFNQRERISWDELVGKSWLALGGPATADNEEELEYAETYLELLKVHSLNIGNLQKKLSSIYISSVSDAKIQIMTIHKAKGLEFDHIIIPGINRATRSDERKLMLWLERPKLHHGSSLLLAPIAANTAEPDHVYQYLRLIEQKKSFYETGRLLYVAMTRAKKSIYISGNIKTGKEKESTINIQTNSLLEQLTPCFNQSWINLSPTPIASNEIDPLQTPDTTELDQLKILRLQAGWQSPIAIPKPTNNNLPTWHLEDNQASIIGTVVHYILCQMSGENNLDTGNDSYISDQQPYWQKLLQQSGYIDIQHGLKLITKSIKNILSDKRGQWILYKHQEATSELAITTRNGNKFNNLIIDRTFINDDGTRWIIDYKISAPTTETLEEFLHQEQKKYSNQLVQYATAIKTIYPITPIKLGLYFPLCRGWIECPF